MIRDCAPPLLRRTRRTSPGQRWVKLRRKSTRARQPALSLLVLRELTHFAAAWLRKRFEQPRSAEARENGAHRPGTRQRAPPMSGMNPPSLLTPKLLPKLPRAGPRS